MVWKEGRVQIAGGGLTAEAVGLEGEDPIADVKGGTGTESASKDEMYLENN